MKLLINFFLILFFITTVYAQTDTSSWETVFEKSGYYETGTYEEAVNYFKRLAEYSPIAQLNRFGKTPQGRDLYCLVISKDKNFEPVQPVNRNKPVLLIQNGIHAGEIEGKDASMILLRDILVTGKKAELAENVTILVIPVFNADGHERRTRYGRINQNGPEVTGWRVNSNNLNLNRDYTKADTPELKGWLELYNKWLPDFFVDVHTTDGADHQYTVTYTIAKNDNVPPAVREWNRETFIPWFEKSVLDKGYNISPFLGFIDRDPKFGVRDWVAIPRLSNGYVALRNRPGLLIEMHVLKPYKERVFGVIASLESILELLNREGKKLVDINLKGAEEITGIYKPGTRYPVLFKRSEKENKFLYKGIKSEEVYSEAAGADIKIYTGEKWEREVPFLDEIKHEIEITVPAGYIVPREWGTIAGLLKLHGADVKSLEKDTSVIAEIYKFKDVKFGAMPYEGRFMPEYNYDVITDTVTASKGDYYISINQSALPLVIHLLEPDAPDSFLQWGFFNAIFERKEYFEDYAMNPLAEQMLKENPELAEEFNNRLKQDKEFASDPHARLNFFYERTPYYDQKHNVYPVLRVIE